MMSINVKLAIAEKVKKEVFNCHNIHKTSLTRCEEQYVEYYKHCLHFFGCEITGNTQDRYLNFIVSNPEDMNKSVIECANSYIDPKNKKAKSLHLDFIAGFITGLFFMLILGAILK